MPLYWIKVENLTPKKKLHLVRAARRYVNRKRLHHLPIRYDFVGVVMEDGKKPEINLVKGAWRPRR